MGQVWNTLIGNDDELFWRDSHPENESSRYLPAPSPNEPSWRDLERRRVAQAALGFGQIFRPHWTCQHASGHYPSQPTKAPIPKQASRAALSINRTNRIMPQPPRKGRSAYE